MIREIGGEKLKLIKEFKPVVLEEMVLLTEIRLPRRKADFLERWQGIQFQSEFEVTFEWKCSADSLKCGSKAETSGLEIEISKTEELNVRMLMFKH